jgi:hypothetical protein
MSKYSCTMAESETAMDRDAVRLDLPTDPALWAIRPKFGVAGGPDVLALTDEGSARAYSVGARIRQGAWTNATEALWQAQGRAHLEERVGARIKRTSLGRFDALVWGYLIARGLVESFHDDIGDGVQLTAKGERAHRSGEEERVRLLARCRHAAGVDRA